MRQIVSASIPMELVFWLKAEVARTGLTQSRIKSDALALKQTMKSKAGEGGI